MTRKELMIRLVEAALSGPVAGGAENTNSPISIASHVLNVAIATLGEIEKRFTKHHLYEE